MNKKVIIGLLALSLYPHHSVTAQANQRLKELAREVYYDNNNEPNFIKFKNTDAIYESNTERFLSSSILDENVAPKKIRTENDELGFTHTRYQLEYNNTPIYNAIIIAHAKDGKLNTINGALNHFKKPSNQNSIPYNVALAMALKKVNAKKYLWQNDAQEKHFKEVKNDPDFTFYPKGEFVIYNKDNANYYAYKFPIYAEEPLYGANVFVDAQNGTILAEENLICNITVPSIANTKYSGAQPFMTDSVGPGSYRLRENGRGNGIETYNLNNTTSYANTDFTSTSSNWPATTPTQVAEDAHWAAEMTYDYYKLVHNRNSIDNLGFKLVSYVHYSTNYNNAFWNGNFMTYGDGGGGVGPLTTLDICGHEITHGLTSKTAGLGGGEAGALNEGFSDIFGTTIENYARPGNWDWIMGTDNNFQIRNLSNPKAFGQPDTYLGINWDPGGEVHQNDGPIIFWYYLLCQGKTGVNDIANSYTVTGIGMPSAARIAFRALTVYFVPTTNYNSARNYAIQAASDLFGVCSNETFQTTNAFYAIGVGPASGGTNTPVANFASSGSSMCSLPVSVNFINTSFGANTYLWDFGDGSSTSTTMNPAHTYTANGTYNVKLKSTSVCNVNPDSITKNAYIVVNAPVPPTANGGTVCGSGTASLTASGSGQQYWFNSASTTGTPLYIGNTFATPFISANTTYYVANTFTNAPINGGPVSYTIGTNANFPGNTAYDIFDVLQPCTLKTVVVKANFTASRTIQLRNSSNAVITSTTINVPVGTSTINLDFAMVPGTGYRLGLSTSAPGHLFRNTTGTTYPYNIGGYVNITGSSSAGPIFYYFYDWQIAPGNCSSIAVPVTASVMPGPTFTINSQNICSGQTATLNATGATNYTWSTGSNANSIVVSPTATSIYTVDANNGGCTASMTTTVAVSASPSVSMTAAQTNVCASDSLVPLTGSPSGGLFTGAGVVGNNFNPPYAGAGTYTITYSYTNNNNCIGTANTVMTVGACVGIQEYSNTFGISIFPNPASDYFILSSENKNAVMNIQIFDGTAKLILEKSTSNAYETVDVSKLAKGIYFIEVKESCRTVYRAKMVKQ